MMVNLNSRHSLCCVHLGNVKSHNEQIFKKVVTFFWGPTPLAKSADSNWEWVLGRELSLALPALRTATPKVCSRPAPM